METLTPESRMPGKGDLVEGEILRRIADGTWSPGCRIPGELELSELFGVSRSSVRRAISRLTGRGILNAVQGGGTYVSAVLPGDYLKNALSLVVMDGTDFAEMREFRLMLEPSIAAKAALRVTPVQLAGLEACIARQEDALLRSDLDAFLEEDMLFHGTIARAAGNSLLNTVVGLCQELFLLYVRDSAMHELGANAIVEHREILRCFEAHDSDRAFAAMHAHLYRSGFERNA